MGIARWIGLLKNALTAVDVDRVAWLLDGVGRLAESLGADSGDPISRRRRIAWLGSTGSGERRRNQRSIPRRGGERDRVRPRAPEHRAALPSCALRVGRSSGRSVSARDPASRSDRVRACYRLASRTSTRECRPGAFDYFSTPCPVSQAAISGSRFGDVASRSFRAIADSYREARLRFGGIAEPFCLVAPAELDDDGDSVAMVDRDKLPLPLAQSADPSMVEALRAFLHERRPLWIAGRLVDAAGTLMMVPASVAAGFDGNPSVLRIS